MVLLGHNFEWKDKGRPKGVQVGFIAQELNEVIPSVCDYDCCFENDLCEGGGWGVRPAFITSVLVEGIKEQNIIVEKQQEEITTLKTELNIYKEIINKLVKSSSFAEFKRLLV